MVSDIALPTDHNCFDTDLPKCTSAHYTYHFSECTRGSRSLYYSWKKNAFCAGGVGLPVSKVGLICPKNCPGGSYLPLGTNTCLLCPPGTYSLGGGVHFTEFNNFTIKDFQFSTYCEDLRKDRLTGRTCGWKAGGDHFDSNIAGQHSTRSVLELNLWFKQDGNVSFTARIDSEVGFDVLIFEIDGQVHTPEIGIVESKVTYVVVGGHHTLRWIYQKDQTVHVGEDTVWIEDIVITGLQDHDDTCVSCPPGTYAPTEGSTECLPCPMNTYAPYEHTTTCQPCSSAMYALPGSKRCSARPICVAGDYYHYYTECTPMILRREKVYDWVSPQICYAEDVQLPPPEDVPCGGCSTGHFRETHTGRCETCPPGQFTNRNDVRDGATSCHSCPIGYGAPPELHLDSFHTWPSGFETGCRGQCGTNGWRLHGDFTDSGDLHGGHVTSWLQMKRVDVAHRGSIDFVYSISCTGPCYFELFNNGQYVGGVWAISNLRQTNVPIRNIALGPGSHRLMWVFGKWNSESNHDRVNLMEIQIRGVTEGGSSGCQICPAGTYGNGSVAICPDCPPGHTSGEGAQNCAPCAANHWPAHGIENKYSCLPCGYGTVTRPGEPDCNLNGCRYRSPQTAGTYDLTPFANTWHEIPTLEGTIWIHPCNKSVGPCFGDLETPVPTFACLKTNEADLDFGQTQGYIPHYNASRSEDGITLEFVGIRICDARNKPRNLRVHYICDRTAGFGSPEADVSDLCNIKVTWKSELACHACTDHDYEEIIHACEGNIQEISYAWKSEFQHCQGRPLPPSHQIECVQAAVCHAGQYYASQECKTCGPRSVSLGDGVTDRHWSQFPKSYSTSCTDSPCSVWTVQDGNLVAGLLPFNEYSEAKLTHSVAFFLPKSAHPPSVSFVYETIGVGLFELRINGHKVWEQIDSSMGDKTVNHPFSSGDVAILDWVYVQKPAPFTNVRPGQVQIKSITFYGTQNARSCETCDMIRELPNGDHSQCIECPVNSVIQSGACTACRSGTIRHPGKATACETAPLCNINDYVLVYKTPNVSTCGRKSLVPPSRSFVLPTPIMCRESGSKPPLPPLPAPGTCLRCPYGLRETENGCEACPLDQYLNGNECKNSAPRSVVILSNWYFSPTHAKYPQSTALPRSFTTSCTGTCTTNGWHRKGEYVTSGRNFGRSTITMTHRFVSIDPYIDPEVSFTLRKFAEPGDTSAGLEFFIDGIEQDIPFHYNHLDTVWTFTVPRSEKKIKSRVGNVTIYNYEHTLSWVVTHNNYLNSTSYTLKELQISGGERGVATFERKCPDGSIPQRVPETGVNKKICVPCGINKYHHLESDTCKSCPRGNVSLGGKTYCDRCGVGSYSSTGTRGYCDTTCQFFIYEGGHIEGIKYVETLDVGNVYVPGKTKYAFDLSAYVDHSYSMFIEEGIELIVSPCKRLAYQGITPSHMVLVMNHTSYSVGELSQLKEFNVDHPKQIYFEMEYYRSQHPPPMCTNGVDVTISFRCRDNEIDLGLGTPAVRPGKNLRVTEKGKCKLDLAWPTSHACAVCTLDDWTIETGECINGFRKHAYLRTGNSPCLGAVPMEPWETDCSKEIQVTVSRLAVLYFFLTVLAIGLFFVLLWVAFWGYKKHYAVRYESLTGKDIDADSESEDGGAEENASRL